MNEKEISDAELAEAFKPVETEEKQPEQSEKPAKKKSKQNKDTKKKWGITIFIIGLLTLAAGVTFLLITVLKGPRIQDADYLVQVGKWELENEPSVVWNFTEIGKGTLTTNSHLNDYDFIWRIDGDTLKIETKWLYELNDEYTYKLDQGKNTLTLSSESGDINFVPASSVNPEVTEDN